MKSKEEIGEKLTISLLNASSEEELEIRAFWKGCAEALKWVLNYGIKE